MSESNGKPRIELLGDHKKKGGNKESPVSREQAMRDAQEIAIKVVEWHMQQVPGLIQGMVNGALVAYGLVELTPTKKGADGGTSDMATPDPASGDGSSGNVAQIPSSAPEATP
jgi:hypothetical protein